MEKTTVIYICEYTVLTMDKYLFTYNKQCRTLRKLNNFIISMLLLEKYPKDEYTKFEDKFYGFDAKLVEINRIYKLITIKIDEDI